jgi:hypothetical protein
MVPLLVNAAVPAPRPGVAPALAGIATVREVVGAINADFCILASASISVRDVAGLDESEKLSGPMGWLLLRIRMQSSRLGHSGSAGDLRPQIQPRTPEEHGIVGDQRQAPADSGGSDPKIGVVETLVERMAHQSTLVPKLCDRLDGLAIDVEHPDAIGHLLNLA